jgi:hypothetical protein
MEMQAQEQRSQMEKDVMIYGLQKMIKPQTSGLKGVISRLVATYRIPSVHPFASLTTISIGETADPVK